MSVWFALLLGLVQGITEFLPVSSSAHLCLLQRLFPAFAGQESLTYDVLLHLATLFAVCAAFWQEVRELLAELGHMLAGLLLPPEKRAKPNPGSRRLLLLLGLGTLPLGLGALVGERIQALCGSLSFMGLALLCTGGLLFLSTRLPRGRKDASRATAGDALLVGLSQALALIPGLSRSGTTITAGLARGFHRDFAVKYSFLLSIPAILGANVFKLRQAFRTGLDLRLLPVWLLGMLGALASGYLSIRLVRSLSRRDSFGKFCYYCWGLGLLCLLAGQFIP